MMPSAFGDDKHCTSPEEIEPALHPGSDKLLELLKHVFIGLLEVPVVTGPCSGTLSGLGYPYGRETLETVFWAVKRTSRAGPCPGSLGTGWGGSEERAWPALD